MTLRLYPFAPIQGGVPPPDIDPDSEITDSLVCVTYQGAWQPYVLGALATLLARQTWLGSESTVTLAIKRSNNLLDLFMGDDCIMPGIFDLRQSGLLIQRQDVPGGAWTDLYDPRGLLIASAPDATHGNKIIAPADVRGLWIQQAGGDMPLVTDQQGATGRSALFVTSNMSNTDEVLLLDRAAQNGDMLRVKPGVGSVFTVINRYGHITAIVYNANLPAANAATLGSIIYLNGSAIPTTFPDGAYIGSFNGSSYVWSQFKGATGATGATGGTGGTGATGATGHGIEFTDPPSVAVNTNVAPYFGLDNANPAKTFVTAYLPKAPVIQWLPVLTGAPGTNVVQANATDTNGNPVVQLTIPAGENGTGGSTFDNVPPNPGATKTYNVIVPHDGFIVPFMLNQNWEVSNVSAKGLWLISDNVLGTDTPTDANGFEYTTGNTIGELQIGLLQPTDASFQWGIYGNQDIFLDGSYVGFRQHTSTNLPGKGWLEVTYDVFAAIVVRHDFYRLAVQGSNPIRYWRSNELTGSALTDLIVGQVLTIPSSGGFILNQAAPWVGDDTRAIHWNGNYAGGANIAALNGNHSFAIELIAKQSGRAAMVALTPDSGTGDDQIQMIGYSSGQFGWYGNGSNISTGALSDALYHHFVCTYDAGTGVRKVYKDGSEIATQSGYSRNGHSGLLTRIGTDIFSGSDWTGCEVAFYDRNLPIAEVGDHYTAYTQSINGS